MKIARTILSVRVSRRSRRRRPGRGGALGSLVLVTMPASASRVGRRRRGQALKIASACSWMLAQMVSMSSGLFRKSWIDEIITVEAKLGSVSRSRNWVMLSTEPISSTAFFCRLL